MSLQLQQILKDKKLNATKLEILMKNKGYTLSRISIGKIINGIHSPKVSTLEKIANTLDIDVRDMFAPSQPILTQDLYIKDFDGLHKKIGGINY